MLRRSLATLQQAVGQRSRIPVIGLQVLFSDAAPAGLTVPAVTERLNRFDPSLREATLRAAVEADDAGLTGIVSWTATPPASVGGTAPTVEHRVDVIVRNRCPLPPSVATQCITYSLYPQSVKQRMAAAQSAAYLSYRGTDAVMPLEKYVAVSAVAAALCEAGGGCGVLNVNALTSAPASLFSRTFIEANYECAGRTLEFFRALPVTTLYAGFQPYRAEDQAGKPRYGFRTHGAELLGSPNLATYAADAASSEVVFYAFHAIWELMERRGRPLVAGERVQLTADSSTSVTVRDPLPTEVYLHHSPQGVLVLEPARGWKAFQRLLSGAAS
jgi:hypothetical protein